MNESTIAPASIKASQLVSERELRLDIENAKLRQLSAQAGIDAAEHKVMEGVQRLLFAEHS